MRLSKIKLAGFKSFVDPTTVPFPSNLVGVVGPNGCGKSNVIDAVRWVMGESSAKHLRGGTMEDVIFNGSSARKPVGQASVELVFDNTDGSLGGEYAQYNEISVRRVVNRDGNSVYYLNGTRCRRRDITDIFLGTGLGPRSYAIIEQGMIGRMIEAKPEEMRIHLEEAAGISKYKERRRETENRIHHTRENLARLDDLREEITKHLDHLARQKRTAERYRELKEAERQAQAELLALRWRDLAADAEQRERALQSEQTRLEEIVAEQRRAEAELERARESHHEATESFNQIQGRYYRLGAEISSTEQKIQYSKDARQRARDELAQVEREYGETSEHIETDRQRLVELDEALAADRPQQEHVQAVQDEVAEELARAEAAMQQWQSDWEAFNERAAEPAQQAQVQRSRMEQLERHLEQVRQRIARLESERGELDPAPLEQAIHELGEQDEAVASELARLQGALDSNAEALTAAREEQAGAQQVLDSAREEVQRLQGRLSSLEALQQAALGQGDEAVVEWLEQVGVADRPRLAQQLNVDAGWERAVEAVLGSGLEAVCVDDVAALADKLTDLADGGITLVDDRAAGATGEADGRLLDVVGAPLALAPLLDGVYTAPDTVTALARRDRLAANQSFVTPEGVRVGPNWLRVANARDEDSGVLAREQELNRTRDEAETAQERVAAAEAELARVTERIRELESAREATQEELNRAHREHSETTSRLQTRNTQLEQTLQRQARIDEELRELREQLAREEAELEAARHSRNAALEQSEAFDAERVHLQERREQLAADLEDARQRAREHRDEGHRIEVRLESTRSSREATAQNLERMEQRLQQLQTRREELQQTLDSADAPIRELESELEDMVQQRLAIEQEMASARAQVESIEQQIRELEQTRGDRERRAGEIREQVSREQMAVQEVRVRRQTLEEQLGERGLQVEPLIERVGEDATAEAWQTQVDALVQKIERLGPVNLAAIDEYEEESKRKAYLDEQHTDVAQALETLEKAIERIDRETRSRFKQTFEQVNARLQELFPRLFGGGSAHLEMSGDDLLSTGVTIMARPPGKRVSNIHLLSGGEKALTAVALVFAFFELNPAPFCLLDEVDAPLDDANVGRYCELVREMSERVQFIFITHNKQTMELTNQLTGVTMREAGVSRLVAVDVQEAADMAQA